MHVCLCFGEELGAEVQPHDLGALPKGVDIQDLEEVEVALQVPLEDGDYGLVELGEVFDLARLVEAVAPDYGVCLVACQSVEAYLKQVLALGFKGLVFALEKVILAVL
jgi:hypothetical protein